MVLVAVDFKNVSIVGHYVKDRTKDAQFIIIRFDELTNWILTDLLFNQAIPFMIDCLL